MMRRGFSWRWLSPPTTATELIQQMPDVRGPPVIGAITSTFASKFGLKLHEYIDKLHAAYGPIFRAKIGPAEQIFVCSPNDMKEIFYLEGPTPQHFLPEAWLYYNQMRSCKRGLLFMDGQEWLDCRRKLNRVFLGPNSASEFLRPCQDTAQEFAESWRKYERQGCVVPNLECQLYQYLIKVLLANLMGTGWLSKNSKFLKITDDLAINLRQICENSVYLAAFRASTAQILHLPWWTRFVKSADYSLTTISNLVDEMFKESCSDGMLNKMKAQGISDDVLKRIVVDLVVAAGDVTAFTIQWILYLLSKHQDVQSKIYETIRHLDASQIVNDNFLKATIKESLRLYPTAPFIARALPQDAYLAGYPVHRGEIVVLSLYTSGRDEANFSKAQEFIPERWIRNEKGELKGVISPQASMPFAMGVRSCLGKKLAETQIALTVAQLLKNFEIDMLNKDKIEIKLRLITAPSQPLQLILRPRH